MEAAALLLRAARQRAGLTQAQLARRLGTSQAAVAKLERSASNPTVATLDRTLRAIGHRLELTATERAPAVDETLIASYMRLSPAERLQAFQSSHDSLLRLRRLAGADGA